MAEKERNMAYAKYLIAKESDYRWGLVTNSIGYQEALAGAKYPSLEHPHGYYFTPEKGRKLKNLSLLYIFRGEGWFESEHCKRRTIKAGDIVAIFPNEWHSYAPNPAVGWKEAWVCFEGDFADRMIREKFLNIESPIIHIGVSYALWNLYERAYQTAVEEEPGYQQMLAGYVGLIVGTIYSGTIQHKYSETQSLNEIQQARAYMRENVLKNLNMEDVAREVGMGYSKFRKLFKHVTGFSPMQYFIKMKMEAGKELLQNTHLSCKEIAFKLGFDSPSHFCKMFRLYNGISPQQFRE